jgi:N-acyl-D-amino-acid deacylase
MDVIIRNVSILDGSGARAYLGDIALQDDQIAAIASHLPDIAAQIIDGSGLAAAPGFIDIHSHSDLTLPLNPRAESKVRQGVTTEVVGNCGFSPAPVYPQSREVIQAVEPRLPLEWNTFGEFLDRLRQQGIAVNLVPLVGCSVVRSARMGLSDSAATTADLAAMQRLIAQAMDEGAWGVSSGLIYPPGSYASTEELIELSRVAADRRGFYFSHIRGEAATLLQAIGEAIEIGERAGLPVQIAHLKTVRAENWPRLSEAIKLLEAAQDRGADVMADRYPYVAASNRLVDQLPKWAHDGGPQALLMRLQEPAGRRRLVHDLRQMRHPWDKVLIAYAPGAPDLEGQTVGEIAGQRGTNPDETVPDLVLETGGRATIVDFVMSEDNLRTVLRHPLVMIGSDGSSLLPEGPLGEGKVHPRNYGTFPRVLGKYVREERVLSLPEAVHKMTGLPAKRLGLPDQGRLAKGMKADLVLFNPDTVIDKATYTSPHQYPSGIEYVFVNGRAVITPQGHTGALPGRILSR